MSEWKCKGEMEFDGDVVITDPCYITDAPIGADPADGIEDALCSSTYYGDWGCTVFETKGDVGDIPDGSEYVGNFCADAGLVCVMDMRYAVRLNPGIEDWIAKHSWCATVIREFKGKARLMVCERKESSRPGGGCYVTTELRVRLDGEARGRKVSFESMQTSA